MPEPEPGDKVSWNWGGGKPGGTVAEKKTEGEIAITSKRGNKIKKNADKDDPAVHIERSGNDVVKRASELNVEKKGSGSKGAEKKSEDKEDDNKGEKRKHDKVSKEAGDDEKSPLVENSDGKEVKPGGKDGNKKQKKEDKPAAASKKEDKSAEKKEDKKEDKKSGDGEKKKPGRPKKGEGETKKKKDPTPRKEGDLVSSRTRSRGK